MLITACCLTSQQLLGPKCAWKQSSGFEARCDEQQTEAHYSNAHLIAKQRRSYLQHPRKTSNSD